MSPPRLAHVAIRVIGYNRPAVLAHLAHLPHLLAWFLEELGTHTPAEYSLNLMPLIHAALPQYGATRHMMGPEV